MPVAALAHDGYVGVTVEPARVNPGGVIMVAGHNIATDDELLLSLVGGTLPIPLGTVVTDGEGHFSVGARIPADVATGAYFIEASAAGIRVATPLSVDGSPIFDGQDGAPPGRDIGLPGQPSAGTQVAPGPVATGPLPTSRPVGRLAPLATDPGSGVDLVPFVALAGALAGLGILAWGTRRRPAAPTGSSDLP